ncbi:MAG TPA: prolyl oligopeptidase family serine peptidase [Kofleriaceae bacterium]|nr:prolyl oligopeptidase family serine peptidase [Kofleriaceae bacterium]
MQKTLALTAALVAGCCPSSTSTPTAPPAPEQHADQPPVPPPEEPKVADPTPAPPASPYPATRRDDIVDEIHGVQVADPYRWLEDASQPEVAAWMDAEDGYARAQLAALPGRDRIASRLKEVFYYDALGAPTHCKDRYFYSRKLASQEKNIVYWKKGKAGTEQVLLDPNGWSTDGSAGLSGWWPSRDGKLVAYNRNEHNSDEAVMFIRDVDTGKDLADTIPGTKYSGAAWTPDSKGFYYTWVPPVSDKVTVADRPGFAEVRYHAIGTDPANDPVVRPATGNPETFLGGWVSWDGRWLMASVQHGWNSTDIYYRDLHAKGKKAEEWHTLVENVPALFDVTVWKDHFYVTTNDGAPRYRVFKVDPGHADRKAWKEIVPESDAVLESVGVVGDHLVLTYLRDASSELEVRSLEGKAVRKVALPGIGTTGGIGGNPDEDTGYFGFSSFTEPSVIFETSIKSGKVSEWSRVKLPIDTTDLVTEQVRFPSKDGTSISMFLIHRKDAKKDGSNPTILYGYGGFNVSMTPGFSSSRIVWLELGGMYAIPNLRGGGEYGEDWHKDGMQQKKQNVFDDYIASAHYLIDQGWTSKDHLAIYGGSNGGLLVGAAMTQAPDLYKAVVCAVPLLDMVRYHLFGSGKTWIPEYGSADDAEQFKALYAYSPYHHVRDGVTYPALLMLSSDHDDRVDPMHARKFVAAVQHAMPSGTPPVWLRIEKNAGHGGADVVKQQVEQGADLYAFLAQQLGIAL